MFLVPTWFTDAQERTVLYPTINLTELPFTPLPQGEDTGEGETNEQQPGRRVVIKPND